LDSSLKAQVNPRIDKLSSLHNQSDDRSLSGKEIREERGTFEERRVQIPQTGNSLTIAEHSECDERKRGSRHGEESPWLRQKLPRL
jgi:hypothetical protein